MRSRLSLALEMVRAHPLRTALLGVLPLVVAALQLYHGLAAADVQHAVPTTGFAVVLVGYAGATFRVYLARYRVESLGGTLLTRH